MGKNNSSKCRVRPFMDYMMADMERLAAFLADMGISVSSRELEDAKINFDGHNGEKCLTPPCDYLTGIISDLPDEEYMRKKIESSKTSEETKENRLKLLDRNNRTFREDAIRTIIQEYRPDRDVPRSYQFLEKSAFPDVFIETDSMVIVIEGKWTEKVVTESTTFVKRRNQMVRHLHNALYYAGGKKKVFGFYIVAEDFPEIEKLEKHSFTEKLEDQFGIGEWKTRIDDAYMGYTTWERITQRYPDLKAADGWKESAE